MTDPQRNPQNTGGTPVPPPTPPPPSPKPAGGTPVPPPPPKATPTPPPPPPQHAQPPAGYGQQQGQQGGYMPPQQGGGMGYPPMPPQGGGYPQYADPYGYQQMPPQQGGGYPPPPYGYPPQGGYAPQGGYMPPQQGGGMGYPPMPQGGGYPPMPGGMPGGMPPEDMTPANFQLGTKFPRVLKVKCPPHGLKFDEEKFIRLLAGSISLAKDEKKKIVESVPKLKQEQIDELIKIFEEEKQKFAALSKKHVPQLEKLADQHYAEWMQLEGEMEQEGKKKVDQQKADEIRKNLGL